MFSNGQDRSSMYIHLATPYVVWWTEMKTAHFWQTDTAYFYSIVCSHYNWHASNLAAFSLLTNSKVERLSGVQWGTRKG